MSDEARAEESGDMEGLPRPAESPAEASDRFVTFMASVLIAVGWLGGAAVAAFGVYCAVIIKALSSR